MWIVKELIISDFDVFENKVKAFHKKDDAQEYFKKLASRERNWANERNWEIEDDTDTYFESYPAYASGENSSRIYLEEIDVL